MLRAPGKGDFDSTRGKVDIRRDSRFVPVKGDQQHPSTPLKVYREIDRDLINPGLEATLITNLIQTAIADEPSLLSDILSSIRGDTSPPQCGSRSLKTASRVSEGKCCRVGGALLLRRPFQFVCSCVFHDFDFAGGACEKQNQFADNALTICLSALKTLDSVAYAKFRLPSSTAMEALAFVCGEVDAVPVHERHVQTTHCNRPDPYPVFA
jgi:hypothetical protein